MKKEDIMIRFGRKVKYYRIKKGYTQDELATITHVHQHYISDVERGKRNVTLKAIEKLAQALHVNEEDLF